MTVVSFIGRSFAFGIAALNLATTMHAVAAFNLSTGAQLG